MKKLFYILFPSILFFSCAKERLAGESEQEVKLSTDFTPTTTPIHVLSNGVDIDDCFYPNNFIKLIGYQPNITQYTWYKYEEDTVEFLSHDPDFQTSVKGDYRLDVEMNVAGFGEIDTTVYINLEYCETSVEIPETFLPDGDGQFDTWLPIFIGVSDFYVRVMNENSQIVFESESENNRFMGSYNGSQLPAGSYRYYLSGTFRSGYIFEQQGFIELIR